MKIVLKSLFVAAHSLLFVPLMVAAQMSDEQALSAVLAMLEEGKAPAEIIGALRDDGRMLNDAGVIAVTAATPAGSAPQMARAAICAAENEDYARGVTAAILAVVEDGGAVAAEAAETLAKFDDGGCNAFDDVGDGYEPGGGTPVPVSPS